MILRATASAAAARPINQADDSRRILYVELANRERKERRENHAVANRFSVKKLFVARGGLERVPESVAEIQNLPQAAFALVFGDNFRFDSDTSWNHEFERRAITAQQGEHVAFEIAEQGRDQRLRHI